DRAGQSQRDPAQVLIRLGALLTLSPRRHRDPGAAERDHDEGADEGERQHELEQGEAALTARHRVGLGIVPMPDGVAAPGIPGLPTARGGPVVEPGVVDSADVRRLTISTPRLSPQLTFTSIW